MSSGRIARLAAAVTLLAGIAAAREVPYLGGRVVDEAALLTPAAVARISQKLEALEREGRAQMAVLVVTSLGGEQLESFSLRVVETWKLGRRDRDDGLLLLVARDERRMRFEVGYGLEGLMTDARSRRILDEVIRPRFREGRHDEGIEAAVDAVAATLREEPGAIEARSPSPPFEGLPARDALLVLLVYLFAFGSLSLHALHGSRAYATFMYFLLAPFHLMFGALLLGSPGVAFLPLWLAGFPLVRWWRAARARARRGEVIAEVPREVIFRSMPRSSATRGSAGWSIPSGWSSAGSRSSSSSSSGGFSGGGGSFGGGGASSGW